jgi:hypothetical protein
MAFHNQEEPRRRQSFPTAFSPAELIDFAEVNKLH